MNPNSEAQRNERAAAVMQGIGGLLLLAGAIFILGGLDAFRTALVSTRWPAANGMIITSTVTGPVETKYGLGYGTDISYQYTVSGDRYVGSVIDPVAIGHDTMNYAQGLVQRYPLGRPVKVYYDPDDPENAVLVPGQVTGALLLMVMPVLLGGFLVAAGQTSRDKGRSVSEQP